MQPKYAMVIDASKCFDCKACIVACQLENGVPPRFERGWIKHAAGGQETKLQFQPGNCMQCDEPSCVEACPVGATFKSRDGRVLIDIADKCDFCQRRLKRGLEPACVVTCPTRARVFGDLNDPSSEVSRLLKRGGLVRVVNLKVDTKPNIYYMEGTMPLTWPAEPTLPGNVHMPLGFWRKSRT